MWNSRSCDVATGGGVCVCVLHVAHVQTVQSYQTFTTAAVTIINFRLQRGSQLQGKLPSTPSIGRLLAERFTSSPVVAWAGLGLAVSRGLVSVTRRRRGARGGGQRQLLTRCSSVSAVLQRSVWRNVPARLPPPLLVERRSISLIQVDEVLSFLAVSGAAVP